jgi:DNA-binding transcriptional ArsR family regulator
MERTGETDRLSATFGALADPTRRAILDELRSGPRTTGMLADAFPTTRFAVMKHLGVLVEVGLVTVERRGRARLNHLNPVPLQQAYDRWVHPLAAPVASVALRLGHSVATDHTETPTHATAPDHTETPTHAAPPDARATSDERAEERMDYGLDVRAQHTVRASADRTWHALLELHTWWPPCWPDGARLLFEPWVGGRLGTTFDRAFDQGARGSLWGTVAELHPGRELVLDGTMGMPGPIAGRWRMTLDADGAATHVTVEHRVLGDVGDDDRAGFTRGWVDTLARLGAHAEAGS